MLSRHRLPLYVLVCLVIAVLLWTGSQLGVHQFDLTAHICSSLAAPSESQLLKHPQRRKNVAFVSQFGFHFDVYLALVSSLEHATENRGSVQVYAPSPFAFEFQKIVDLLGLYHGTVNDPDHFLPDIEGNNSIDLVIIGTCEVDMKRWSDNLLKIWNNRSSEHKFKLACVVHNAVDDGWQEKIPDWSRRNAIRLLPISDHVGKYFRGLFNERAGSADPHLHTAAFEQILIDAHVPILDLPDLKDLLQTRRLTNVVIQGAFDSERRDYPRIFNDLMECIKEDSKLWGYLPLGSRESYEPDPTILDSPFKLHLMGSGYVEVPQALHNVVVFHPNLNYTQFYDVISGMDVCLTAFTPQGGYYLSQASSTVVMCLETNVPILVTQRGRDTYVHINDDRVSLLRPAVMSEIRAIEALRSGNASRFLERDPSNSGVSIGSHAPVRHAVESMVRKGWIRSKKGFQEWKSKIYARNMAVATRLIRDL